MEKMSLTEKEQERQLIEGLIYADRFINRQYGQAGRQPDGGGAPQEEAADRSGRASVMFIGTRP